VASGFKQLEDAAGDRTGDDLLCLGNPRHCRLGYELYVLGATRRGLHCRIVGLVHSESIKTWNASSDRGLLDLQKKPDRSCPLFFLRQMRSDYLGVTRIRALGVGVLQHPQRAIGALPNTCHGEFLKLGVFVEFDCECPLKTGLYSIAWRNVHVHTNGIPTRRVDDGSGLTMIRRNAKLTRLRDNQTLWHGQSKSALVAVTFHFVEVTSLDVVFTPCISSVAAQPARREFQHP